MTLPQKKFSKNKKLGDSNLGIKRIRSFCREYAVEEAKIEVSEKSKN